MAAQYGISAWRRLDDEPYYKMVTDYSGELTKSRSSRRLLRKVTSMSLFNRSNKQDGIYKMCLSPEGNQLVTVHQSGLVALWDVPSLKSSNMWTLENQVELHPVLEYIIFYNNKTFFIKNEFNSCSSLVKTEWRFYLLCLHGFLKSCVQYMEQLASFL